MDFYPEGGYLVPEVENAVAFKMHDPGNMTVEASGELVDEQGTVVAPLRVEHDGMGVVRFTPRADGRYTARWRDNFDEFTTFNLPQVRTDATVVQVRREGDSLNLKAVGARAAGSLLVVQQRGRYVTQGYESLAIDPSRLEPGVVQAMLFDEGWHCLSERLFYAAGKEMPSVPLVTDRNDYNDREHVKVDMDLGELTREAGSHCAVAVVDDNAAVATDGNIYANLLLQSDLRGNIHDPGYYFEQGDSVDARERGRHLDMLMLTQGWRRYDVPRVLKGLVAEPQYPLEVSQVVTGRVLSEFHKKPLANAEVGLIIPKLEYADVATTDSLGRFSVPVPLMPDGVDCVVIAMNDKGKKQTNLELAEEQYPENYYLIDADFSSGLTANVQEEQAWRLVNENDWRHIRLEELVVTAAWRRHLPSVETKRYLTADDIQKLGITSVDGALRAIGVTNYEKVNITIDGEPLSDIYFTDTETFKQALTLTLAQTDWKNDKIKRIKYAPFETGSDYDLSDVSIADGFISMQNVDFIDFRRGRGGKVSVNFSSKTVTDKVWKEPSRYVKIAHPMGAQQPVEFYSPRYDQGDCGIEPGNDLRRVLYWDPSVKVGEDGKASFDFYASDAHNTTYTILVEGVTPDGTLVRSTRQVTKH